MSLRLRVQLLFMILGLLLLGGPAAARELGAIHVPADYPTITAVDVAGNVATRTATCQVPK